MSQTKAEQTGGCLCGAVRFKVSGAPLWAAHCHCTSCRRATGAAMVTFAGYRRAQFAYAQGAPQRFNSSPGVVRSFCGNCGTSLTYEGARWPDEVHVHLSTFDDPAAFAPQAHVYTAEQMPWLKLADDLPRHATTASAAKPDKP
jgi:hypothetical protein